MRFYTIHAPRRPWASTETSIEDARAVKEGFSWPAFFLSFIWALWHRLWLTAGAIFAAEMIVGVIVDALDLNVAIEIAISIGMALIVGWLANDLLRGGLERRGLTDLGVVLADSSENAIERYFTENGVGEPAPPSYRRRSW